MASALCFNCGSEKKDPVGLCGKCMGAPRKFEDVVLSYCLSLECVKPASLETCREYFKRKKKPPRFREAIVDAAILLAAKHNEGSADTSIEFSSAMFNFTDLESEEDVVVKRRTVTANIIGRRKGQGDDEPSAGIGSKYKTYHVETWIIGKDISEQQVKEAADGDQVFVYFRWINDHWTWSCVSRGKFAQLKAVEDGHPF